MLNIAHLARPLARPIAVPAVRASLRFSSTDAYGATARPGATEDDITITLAPESFETYELQEAPPTEVHLSKKKLLEMFREMYVVRRLETAADALYKAQLIHGFCHLSSGQEAIAIGIEEASDKRDSVITSYRCHGFEYTRGAPIEKILAELMGRQSGVSKGKGGSMHMYTSTFFGGNGIVGAQVPLGLGLAYAHKYKKDPLVSWTLYGDGASNQGQVFESYNMAKLWNVPVIFACENNNYGMGTPAKRASALTEFYKRGQYIPGLRIDGMDVVATYQGSKFAREYALKHGPIVLEYVTYRYGGHSMSDPGTTYRTREEVQNMRKKHDPIKGLTDRLIKFGVATEDQLKQIENEVRKQVEDATAKAKAAPTPEPTPENLFADIYAPGSEPEWVRGRTVDEIYHYPRA